MIRSRVTEAIRRAARCFVFATTRMMLLLHRHQYVHLFLPVLALKKSEMCTGPRNLQPQYLRQNENINCKTDYNHDTNEISTVALSRSVVGRN